MTSLNGTPERRVRKMMHGLLILHFILVTTNVPWKLVHLGSWVLLHFNMPLSVLVKTPDSQSGKPRSIHGSSDGQALTGSYPTLGAAKVNRRWRGDKSLRQMPDLLKSGGYKTLPLPYDLYLFLTCLPKKSLLETLWLESMQQIHSKRIEVFGFFSLLRLNNLLQLVFAITCL